MKNQVSRLAIFASITAAITMSAAAAVPDLTIRLDRAHAEIVKVSADVSLGSTWILEGASDPDGPWKQLVTLDPSGYQLPVNSAPLFLRLRRGNELGQAVTVFRTELGVELIKSVVKIFPVCPLPNGRWVLQQSPDLKNWTDRASFQNSGYQINASATSDQHLSFRLIARQ